MQNKKTPIPLEFKIDDASYNDGGCDYWNFSARLPDGDQAAWVEIVVGAENRHQSRIPSVGLMVTTTPYQGKGVMGQLLLFANRYCKENLWSSIHSGLVNSKEATRVWEKLVVSGNAVEYCVNEPQSPRYVKKAWRFI